MWDELEKLRAKYLQLGLSNAIDYEKCSMISIVYNSTKIEGCSLSENDTKLLLENDKLLQKKSGYIYWMHKSYIDQLDSKDYYLSSDRIKTMLSISTIIEDQGSYLKLRIK